MGAPSKAGEEDETKSVPAREEKSVRGRRRPGVQGLFRHTLETVGYKVNTTKSDQQALALWKARSCDIVITDLVLASSRGVDLIRQIRFTDDQVPILAITGFGQEVAQEALDAGADHVLRKPFHLFEVRELIRRLIG